MSRLQVQDLFNFNAAITACARGHASCVALQLFRATAKPCQARCRNVRRRHHGTSACGPMAARCVALEYSPSAEPSFRHHCLECCYQCLREGATVGSALYTIFRRLVTARCNLMSSASTQQSALARRVQQWQRGCTAYLGRRHGLQARCNLMSSRFSCSQSAPLRKRCTVEQAAQALLYEHGLQKARDTTLQHR